MFAAEGWIRSRLEGISGVAGVHGLADLKDATWSSKPLPALFVAPDGIRVAESSGTHKAARLAVRWVVIAAARRVSDLLGGSDARTEVNDIAREVYARLIGWQPPGYQPVVPVNAPPPSLQDGLILLPMAFEVVDVITANP